MTSCLGCRYWRSSCTYRSSANWSVNFNHQVYLRLPDRGPVRKGQATGPVRLRGQNIRYPNMRSRVITEQLMNDSSLRGTLLKCLIVPGTSLLLSVLGLLDV